MIPEEIQQLLLSGDPANIELAYQLSEDKYELYKYTYTDPLIKGESFWLLWDYDGPSERHEELIRFEYQYLETK